MRHIADNPELMKEWDFEKNIAEGLIPEKIGLASHTKANWKCSRGHEWKAMIANRSEHGRGCPYCSHQLPIPGETDLASCFPDLAKEWDMEKNVVSPSEVMPGNHKKAWWKCSQGHSYYSSIKARTNSSGCPYCAGKKALKGFNDLETMEPELAKHWHPTKNGDLTPSQITYSSGKKVWWLCERGHEYLASPDNRRKHLGCPICIKHIRSSFPEQAIYYYVKKAFPDAINRYTDIFTHSMELDIYIPSIKTGIEFDGRVYHDTKDNNLRDSKKYGICTQNGIMLIRVRENLRFTPLLLADHIINIPDKSDFSLNSAISQILYHFGRLIDVNVTRDKKEIRALLGERAKSFAEEYPLIAAEWDYEVNGVLKPEHFSPHSNDKVGWICGKCGNRWMAAIGDRTRPDATGCPVCAAFNAGEKRIKSIIAEKGSFADNYPELLKEWNYEKNTGINPGEVTASSGKKVWWTCKKCGHEWETSIGDRVKGGKCPVCSNRKIIPGYNDFATLYPALLDEWDYEKNIEISPFEIAPHSGKKVSWKCHICGREWDATIATRTSNHGCPNFRQHKAILLDREFYNTII